MITRKGPTTPPTALDQAIVDIILKHAPSPLTFQEFVSCEQMESEMGGESPIPGASNYIFCDTAFPGVILHYLVGKTGVILHLMMNGQKMAYTLTYKLMAELHILLNPEVN